MHPTGKRRFAPSLGAFVCFVCAICTTWTAAEPARAFTTVLPASLAQEALSETVPTAFAAFELSTEDFSFDWLGPAPSGVELRLMPGTIQWVRVADVLVLPRARLLVQVAAGDEGRVSNAGFTQSFAKPADSPGLRSEQPIALISGESNSIDIAFKKAGRLTTAKAVLRFKPRAALGPDRVFTDASCSRFGLRAEGTAQSASAHGWAYIGCRVAEVEGKDHRTSSLEAWVYWDGVGQNLLIGGAPTPSTTASVWPLRLRAEPGRVQLAVPGGGDEMILRYATPENFHRGFVGVGLGPYWDRFNGNSETFSQPSPVITVYGSYFITETLRVVSFDATTLDAHWATDLGFYVNTEYLKFLDRRVVINLLLGAHAIGFNSVGQYYFRIGVPQGVEILFLDFLKKGCNLNTGFFIYPLISGSSYYNVWLRWGSGRVFGEFNYISWDQTVNDQPVHSDSAGFSVGIPLARFL